MLQHGLAGGKDASSLVSGRAEEGERRDGDGARLEAESRPSTTDCWQWLVSWMVARVDEPCLFSLTTRAQTTRAAGRAERRTMTTTTRSTAERGDAATGKTGSERRRAKDKKKKARQTQRQIPALTSSTQRQGQGREAVAAARLKHCTPLSSLCINTACSSSRHRAVVGRRVPC